jgi:gluconokinase
VFDKEIVVTGVKEASAFGAAYLAMAGVGGAGDLSMDLPKMKEVRVVKPNPVNVGIYRDGYREFMEIYGKVMG